MKGILIIAPLILVILLGMALRSRGFLNLSDRERLTRLLYWVVLPALLFRTTYLSGKDVGAHGNLFLATYAAMLLVPIPALLISRFRYPGKRSLHALSAMAAGRSNNLYLGLPAVILALGNAGMEAGSIYLAISLPGYNVISILWGEVVHSGGLSLRALRTVVGRIVKNPLILSCVAGILAAQVGLPIPNTLLVSLKLIGDMATGVALISLGMSLELPNLPAAFRRTWPDVAVKLILHPTVAWGCLTFWPVPEIYFQTALIISAMPTAVNTFILAGGMGLDEAYACEIVAVSTVLAPVTIPLWVALLGIV